MKTKTNKSFGRKCLEGLSAITLGLLPGCFGDLEAYTVTPEMSLSTAAPGYGVRASFRTKEGGEIGFGQYSHSASNIGTQSCEVGTSDTFGRAEWPLFKGDGSQGSGKVSLVCELIRRTERVTDSKGISTNGSTGCGVGMNISGKVGQGELGFELAYATFGNDVVEDNGPKMTIFYKVVTK